MPRVPLAATAEPSQPPRNVVSERVRLLVLLLLAAILVACGGSSSTVSTAPPVVPSSAGWPLLAVTTDDPNTGTAAQVDALASLPRRIAVRVVLDLGTLPADYVASVGQLAAVADVMAQPLDSSVMDQLTAAQAGDRARQYLAALQASAPIWEVGNEVNGNWVGSDPVGKIRAMYDAAKAYGKKTAVTFYYENPPTPGYDMLPWIDANIPPGDTLRTGLDYVLVSYYEDENGGHRLTQAEIDGIFSGLAQRFPNAKVGFGEFGWGKTIPTDPAVRAELISRFLSCTTPVPAYVGGGFYWHFRQTMTPKTQPDYELLRQAAAR